ncbi:uncharacterized protein abca12 isoform X2 [Salarias fasciatus]|uniref:uncharacterized protein abca12 isoform X2 n=1 Tax=Salarias fasciatus TaxID=181472 RepID=UPI001176A621|nr:ATP-binding cassette sub-family A member 12 isoform X2 [Salarias fasciatus]
MAFFGQLRLLLWKNALGIIRQPVWSLTLIIWPLIIFIIVAVTRNQFPPILRDTCYVGPRNLPSAGFFPFLQTLMCNTDSSCHNKSRLADQTISRSSGNARSQKNSPLVNLMQEGDFLKLAYPVEARRDTEELIRLLENILGSPNQGRANETSNNRNTTVGINYESLAYVQDTVNLLKRAVCTLVLPRINTTSPDVLTDAAVQFCTTNDTLFEVSLYTLNQVLTDQVLTEPDEMLSAAGVAVMLFSQLQNESVLWESLLAFPQMFSSGSEADLLSSTDALLTHIQSALRVIEKNFPQAAAPLSMAHPLLAAGINLIRYVQHWPGRAVSITLGDVVTLNNDTLSEILQQVLQGIEIPLDKAIPLTLDKAMVQSYLCENSSNPIWLTAACRTGTVDMLLSMVSPDKVAKKALLAWSRHVAPHDVSFAKGLVYSLIKDLSPGEPEGSTITRTRRSTDAQPENIEEELFLNVGHIVLNLVNALPEVDVVVQSILRSGFQSMKSVTLALNTVEELLSSFLADANNLQQTVDMLLTNQSDSSIWFDRVLDSVMKAIVKGMSSESVTCKEVLGLFEWLLPTETVEIEVWRAMICQNSSRLEQVLLMDWKPLLTQVVELYSTLKGEANFTVPLPMILSEWHQLYNSSMRFGNILYQLPERLDEEYWMNWMPENNTHDIGETLQKSVSLFLVNLGENIERSHLWPEVKDYFHMAYWILNYRPEVTTEPANCSASANLTIHCDTGFRWPVFVQAVTQALMAQSPGVLVNLKGAVNLLQHVYGNTYKGLASLFLKQEIEGGDALSAYLINLINELNEFVQKISTLSDENINDPSVMGPLVSNLFESTGLGPLLPVILSDDPVNVSTVLHVASQLGRHNQHIFTFNESDPTMPDLQSLIVEFLSVGGNLTIPLSHIMGNSLLTYVGDIHPDKLAHVKAALQPFTNQTSAGLVETILSATELLNTLVSPNTNVADAILLYLQEIQKFIISLFRMQKIDQLLSPNGQLSMAQVTDLSLSVMDFLHLFTPEGIHNLTQMGPDAAQDTVIMKFVAVLPPEVQENATYFLQNLKKLQHQAANCPSGQNCLVGISEIFTFLDQVLDMIISGNGNDSIEVAKLSLVMTSEEDQEIASTVLSFLLPPNAVPSVVSFKEVVNFIRLAIAAPNITVTSLQNALIQSGLTFQELQMFAELAGGTDIGELLVTMLELVNVQQCFQPQDDPMVTVHCVTELVNRLSGFLMQVPSLHDNRAVLSLIPQIVNRTISDTIQANFSSSPDRILVQALNSTLSNIKTVLHQNQLNSPEIMREIRVVEGLIRFIASIDPNELFNATLMNDPVRAQTVYLQLVGWYLQKLETITRNSSASEFLQPFFQVAQMQVTIQLAQTNLSMFISNRIENLMNNLQRPVDGAGLKMIGLTSVEILDRLWDSIKMNLEYQNMIQDYQLFNESVLYSTEQQIKLYLGFIQEWMKQPSVPLVLTNMLQWGNSSVLVSERLTDIRDLMQTLPAFLSGDQQAYLSVINNITRSLNEAIMLAESGGLQSEAFTAAILKAVQTTMHLATTATGPLPHAVQENILEIVRDSLSLIVHPNMSFASSRNISLRILKRAEHIVTDIIPQEAAGFPLAIIKVITTYFRTISEGGGPDKWNELILNEMKTIQSLLPPNSTAQYYISELINITNFVLESGQGNMSLWAAFENAAEGNVSGMMSQALSSAVLEIIRTALDLLNTQTGLLPHPVQENILEIVQDSLSLILHPNMSFTSSRNISLHILKRAEHIVTDVIPQEAAGFPLAIIKVITTYFRTISGGGGPDKWNELILNEMNTIQSLLPPNSTAQYYISELINITNFILESGQGNMSLWAAFENAAEGNVSGMMSQALSSAILEIIRTALDLLNTQTGLLPHPVQENILEIVRDSLSLIVHPNMSFASSRNVSLHILKRAEHIVTDVIPQEAAGFPLAIIKVINTYFRTISGGGGPDKWNELIVNEMKVVLSFLPPNSTEHYYISTLINATEYILASGDGNSSFWANFQNTSEGGWIEMIRQIVMVAENTGDPQSDAFSAAILEIGRTFMDLLSPTLGSLPRPVQQSILEIVRDSLSLTLHPNMSFALSRHISLRILTRVEKVVSHVIPEGAAGYLIPLIKATTTYFETISEGGGPDNWNELIVNEMKVVLSFLPPNSTEHYYISTLINATEYILASGDGNSSLWATFQNTSEGGWIEMIRQIVMVAENTGDPQSDAFSAAILEIGRTFMDLLSPTLGSLPRPVQQSILEIVRDSLSLTLHPNMSFASSRHISLRILTRVEKVVSHVIPEGAAGYLIPLIKATTTYFETISEGGGPDNWNELIVNEMKVVLSFLPPNSTEHYYISTLINATEYILASGDGNSSLWANFQNTSEGGWIEMIRQIVMVAENTGDPQSDASSAAILEIGRTFMDLLSPTLGSLPRPVQQNILEVVRDSLSLTLHPNMSFASSRHISLRILKRAESIVTQIIPEEAAGYVLSVIKVATTYFETISEGGGPDKWNELILNEMMTVQSLLPPNSAAQYYVSVIINVTNFILESDQGNASLWTSLQNASEENLPEVMGQIGKLFGMIWPLVTGGTGSHSTAAPLEAFHHLAEVLEQMMTGRADKDTWDRFAQMLESLLWLLEDTDLWDNVPSVIPMMEKIIKNVVKTMDAENEMLTSLELPLVTLIGELTQSLNSSDFDDSLVMERMIDAIDNTVKAAQQANGTLECSQALVMWEPVREAAGLSKASLALWCELRLKPVLEAHAAAQTVYSHLNMSHVEEGPISVSAAADRIVEISQCVYKVNVNRTHAMEQLFMTLYNQISSLADITPSPEEEQEFYNQFQNMQLQDSLHFISELLDELVVLEPSLKPYTDCLLSSLGHVLKNRTVAQGSSSLQDRLQEAAVGFLRCANITSYDMAMMWGNLSSFDEASVAEAMRTILKLMVEMKIFGDDPEVYQNIQQLLKSPEANLMIDEIAEMAVWLLTTEASGPDLLHVALAKISDIIRPAMSLLTKTSEPQNAKLIEGLVENALAMLHRLLSTGGFLPPMDHQPGGLLSGMTGNHHQMRVRQRRDVQMKMMREPMDYFLDLLYIDYPTMFKALSVVPTPEDILETAHVFFSNPDLSVVVNGVMNDLQLGWNNTAERTVDATLGVLSYLTVPHLFDRSSLRTLANAVNMLPVGFPFSSAIKQLTRALANESQENLMLMPRTFQTMAALLQISPSDPLFKKQLEQLNFQVCVLEGMESVRLLMQSLSVQPGQLCHSILPGLQTLLEGLLMDPSTLSDIVFQAVVGDPKTYKVHANWTSAFTQSLDLDMDSLRSLRANATSPGTVTVGEMLRNKTAFVLDVERHMMFDRRTLDRLTETKLPNSNLEILSWFTKLRCSNSTASAQTDAEFLQTFCSMSVLQWYRFSVLMARRINFEKLIYRMALPEEAQTLVGAMLQMAEFITDSMTTILPAVSQLQTYLRSIEDLNLLANNEFHQMSRGQRSSISTQATFVTLSRALCSNGILALFGISQLPVKSESDPSSFNTPEREEMIERFKLPRNATPFCMNMYLDMVNTTGGAIAWAFLKPMLMGQILYTPDTPTTRAIMEKANDTLQEFADLRKHSQEWLRSSKYIVDSAKVLGHTLPMLQNSLGNSFVKNFIEMQTDINVGRMKETLSTFSNMTLLLEKNKHILKQISALSTLMVDLSSCIKFDRYRGYDSADQLNAEAQALAKSRDLYASVIFKLPNDEDASREREARSSSSNSTLPPRVSYTIRMHMDNVMRTDRVRNPYFVKDSHISSRLTMRYNRGFVYLQENIDRAIIEIHAGHKVTDLAVQIQPFPYPCYFRDAYLEAISFVFPIMLMIAWVLFVADFVKKLVHERELRLHEYMKMMGVNPFSHFFAWFLECTFYLVLTIFILTMLLKYGKILPHSDASLIFVYFCDYGLSIIAFSYMVSSFFDKTYIAGLSGSLLYILCFFPFIVVMAMETGLTFVQKSLLSLFSPTCFSYASQYASRYESQGEGIHWSNSYVSPIAEDTSSFGWLCWLMLIDSILYFIIGAYIRMVFPGKYGIPAPWYFPFQRSFWADLCCCFQSQSNKSKGLFFSNIIQSNQPVFSDDKGKSRSALTSEAAEDFSDLPVGVALHGLTKLYGNQAAIENLNVSFYEGHVTSLLGHNGAGKTTTMSLLTGLFAPSSGTIEVYGRDMQANIDKIRKELGVCMQYDVLFDHMTTKEHLLLYGQIKAPHWSPRELREQVRTILEETGMYAHRHKRVGTLSGGMKRKLSISIAFIGGSRLVVLDEPTTGVDPCSRRSIWDIVIQHKKHRTIIMSTHHLDEAEVLSDRIAFLERGGLKCCGSPFDLKDKLGQGYKLTLTKKMEKSESRRIDDAELKSFIQAHVPEARLKDTQGGDLVYSLPPFTSSNASTYRSLLTALDSNLDALQLGGYGISDTTLEEVFLQLTHNTDGEDGPLSISETVSDSASIDSFPSDLSESIPNFGDKIKLTSSSTVSGLALAWQQMTAILIKRFHHSRRDYKGLISQILLPVIFVVFAMGLGSIKNDLQHYPELELSPGLYNLGPSYSFFSNQNPSSNRLVDRMMSFPGIDNACLDKSNDKVCSRKTNSWISTGNRSKAFSVCKCPHREQICDADNFQPPHRSIPSSQVVYNLSGINVETYLVATANDFIRNRYGGFAFGSPLPPDLQMDVKIVPKNRTLSKVLYNPEGHHTMPAYLNSLNNLILRANLPADKDPRKYAISVSSHPYFGRADDEDAVVQGMLQILVAMCVLTGYSIMTASFAIYEVNEHHSGSKRLQHIAGISEPFYWTVNFIYDMTIYMIPVTLTVAVIAIFQIPAFTYRQNLAAVTLLLVLFGFSTFPWMYLLSGFFKDAEMAFITYVCLNLFLSINTIISTSILHFISQISQNHPEAIKAIFKKLCHAFLIFPQFNFGNGMLELARMNINVQLLLGYGVDAYKDPFSTDALGWMFISAFIQGLFFFSLRLLLNKSLIRKVRHLVLGRKTVPQVAYEDQDEDVATEHLRVSSGAASSDILQVNQLTKVYQHFKRKIPAVKRLSVGIPAGECFGLLGVNGAGKTTTFKMLTGDVSPTDGSAQIRDWEGRLVDIMECRNKGINIGYCPQQDALDHLLTGEEHLYFYARIRGISKKQIRGVVNYLLKRLELNFHRNIITDGYSCGTRRKLSTALALVGHPQILLLDEPSSGMDPRTKRHLWKIITEEVKGKCAVVLTSHSMEECEALCSRLAIMVKGQFQCLGSLQHIKNRFGSGFTVKMYLAEASCDAEAITGFMQGRFPSTYLKDQHSAMVEYHVPFAPGGVADIFYQLESNKNALRIKHFSVSQTTLDEVFINFAMGKNGMKTIAFDSEDEQDDLDTTKAVQT